MSDDLIARLDDAAIERGVGGTTQTVLREAAARVRELEAELEQWKTWGIVEIAVRNPSVMEYIKHWEGRAERAEAERDAQRARAEREAENALGWERKNAQNVGKYEREADALRAALAATDHLYYDDGDVRTCYEYDDNQKAWEAMAAARAALGDRHD